MSMYKKLIKFIKIITAFLIIFLPVHEAFAKKLTFYGENIVSIHKSQDGETWVHDVKNIESIAIQNINNNILWYADKNSIYRVILDINIYSENKDELLSSVFNIINFLHKKNAKLIISFEWWLKNKNYDKFLLTASSLEVGSGENAAISGLTYNKIRSDLILSFLRDLKKKLGYNKFNETIWGVDIRNESSFVRCEKTNQNNCNRYYKEISYSNAIKIGELFSKSVRNNFPGVKSIASIYCPLTVGMKYYWGNSRNNSKYVPFDIDLINNMGVDVIDLHVYPGGWAGENSYENISSCLIESSVDKIKGRYIIGEIGYYNKYWGVGGNIVDNEIDGLSSIYNYIGCPLAVISWSRDVHDKLLSDAFVRMIHESAMNKSNCI